MNLWDRLLPQTVLTLNLLRQANKTPTVSAYQYVNGPFDYNATPLGPLGCKVQFHESSNRRKTWDPRALTGWYLGTSIEHYCCHIIFCKRTGAERISNTVFFQHRYITRPVLTPEDQIVNAVDDLKSALQQRLNSRGQEDIEVIKRMDNILNSQEPDPGVVAATPPRLVTPAPPRVVTPVHPRVEKPVKRSATIHSGPTTRSKYTQALQDIVPRYPR